MCDVSKIQIMVQILLDINTWWILEAFGICGSDCLFMVIDCDQYSMQWDRRCSVCLKDSRYGATTTAWFLQCILTWILGIYLEVFGIGALWSKTCLKDSSYGALQLPDCHSHVWSDLFAYFRADFKFLPSSLILQFRERTDDRWMKMKFTDEWMESKH